MQARTGSEGRAERAIGAWSVLYGLTAVIVGESMGQALVTALGVVGLSAGLVAFTLGALAGTISWIVGLFSRPRPSAPTGHTHGQPPVTRIDEPPTASRR